MDIITKYLLSGERKRERKTVAQRTYEYISQMRTKVSLDFEWINEECWGKILKLQNSRKIKSVLGLKNLKLSWTRNQLILVHDVVPTEAHLSWLAGWFVSCSLRRP